MSNDEKIVTPRLIFGLTLILIGVAYTLDRFGYLQAGDLIRFWPVVLVVAGLSKMFWPGSDSSRWSGLIIFGIGAWMLLYDFEIIDFSFWDWWPLVLVLVGIRLALQGLGGAEQRRSLDDGDNVNSLAMLGASVLSNNSSNFTGGDLVAFMGGCDVDLRSARIADGPAVIDAFAFWGGVDIKVPEDWNVTLKGIPILGGYEDKTRHRETDESVLFGRQELVIKGFAIMGGVEIKN
ncbi:MAG: DUF5668 domain-containing protein [Acidobacteriota bacterium]